MGWGQAACPPVAAVTHLGFWVLYHIEGQPDSSGLIKKKLTRVGPRVRTGVKPPWGAGSSAQMRGCCPGGVAPNGSLCAMSWGSEGSACPADGGQEERGFG